ncbi:MAG TPA: nucleotide kinase domain-containing protein [Puia sp.]|nr:nucleotide kinase domain-containing protein [Puia sp.]
MKTSIEENLPSAQLSPEKSAIHIFTPMAPARTTVVYESYWRFAALRQEVFFSRFKGDPFPWSKDPILNQYKFTNAYRAADRVSQYLIKNVIYNQELPETPKEVLFRILLFKLFNKIETWELLTRKFGALTYKDFRFAQYDKVLNDAITAGHRIYSAAYIMPSVQSKFGFERKHSNHLKLIEMILEHDTDQKLMTAKTMQAAFEIIKGFPGLGDFLAYQLLIDINYSTILSFSESEFVVPGPGAKGGISKCFQYTAGLSNVEIIKLVTDRQEQEFERLGLSFLSLWGRRLQLIDCQNLFCEVDKFARVRHPEIKGDSNRVKIKQMFRANSKPIDFWFPPKWGINEKIPSGKS